MFRIGCLQGILGDRAVVRVRHPHIRAVKGKIRGEESNAGSVTKLRASDGANLGNFAAGVFPWGIAYDGANIWVANQGPNCPGMGSDPGSVMKYRASDGANLGTFISGQCPSGLAFDGANLWVANEFDATASGFDTMSKF